ncbi:MAG: MBOAT family protein [Spirochaetia bacterium]|nr:MBOAT family protein [Spirochaetia bacterium]
MVLKNTRTYFFIIGVILLLGNLIFFKYIPVTVRLLYDLTGYEIFKSIHESVPLILPLAISFYTFQILAIIIDARRGNCKDDPGFMRFTLFILFFGQLIAGPIMRHSDFFHQIENITFNIDKAREGILLLVFGLFKKIIIADGFAGIVDQVYASPASFNTASIAGAIFVFPLQLYLDFSGYTDMARGMSKLLGITIPENFNAPYLSRSFKEFWQRWHITLSTWLRDYLYISLGGNRVSRLRNYLNLFLTMVLGGLWHGNNYTFLIWGILQGFYLVAEKITQPNQFKIYNFLSPVIIYLLWTFSLIFFRASDLTAIANLFEGLADNTGEKAEGLESLGRYIVFFLIAHSIQWKKNTLKPYLVKKMNYAIIFSVVILYTQMIKIELTGIKFIYFQF